MSEQLFAICSICGQPLEGGEHNLCREQSSKTDAEKDKEKKWLDIDKLATVIHAQKRGFDSLSKKEREKLKKIAYDYLQTPDVEPYKLFTALNVLQDFEGIRKAFEKKSPKGFDEELLVFLEDHERLRDRLNKIF